MRSATPRSGPPAALFGLAPGSVNCSGPDSWISEALTTPHSASSTTTDGPTLQPTLVALASNGVPLNRAACVLGGELTATALAALFAVAPPSR